MIKTTQPISFFPPSSGAGKWHSSTIGGLARCGAAGVTVAALGNRIQIEAGTEAKAVHPICCRRCLKLACTVS